MLIARAAASHTRRRPDGDRTSPEILDLEAPLPQFIGHLTVISLWHSRPFGDNRRRQGCIRAVVRGELPRS